MAAQAVGGSGGANLFFGGEPGIGRLFGQSMGVEASWLLPAALIGLAAGIWFTRRTARTGTVRAGLLLWGGWLLVTGAVFSFMDGTVHPYYTVALAPAIAALVGISVRELWQGREFLMPRIVLATMSAATGVWAFILLDRTPDWLPALRWIVLAGSVVVAAIVAVGADRLGRAVVVLVTAAALFGLAAPTAFAIYNVTHEHSGPGTMSGPSRDYSFGGPGGAGRSWRTGGRGPVGEADNAALARARRGRRQPLGGSQYRVNGGERPRAQDGCIDHGDRRVHRFGQLSDARTVPAVRGRRPGPVLHRERRAWPSR